MSRQTSKLANLPKGKVIEAAEKMKVRAQNMKMEAAKVTRRALGTLVATGTGIGLGWWMGGLRYERDIMAAEIEAGNEEDPTKFFGVDKDLGVAFGLGTVNVLGLAGDPDRSPLGMLVEYGSVAAAAGWGYGYGLDKGREGAAQPAEG